MEDLQTLRNRLVGLVESFELDDPSTGILAWVPVVGGTFVHPLTRAKVERFLVYGASQHQVKIIEPKFLRSLPLIDISGLRHPSQLCAIAARTLGELLGRLGKIRQDVAALGINLDLEHDLLRLRGIMDVDGASVQIAATDSGQLVVMAIGEFNCGSLEPNLRMVLLTDQIAVDIANLKKRVGEILARWNQPPESPASDPPAAVPIPQVPQVDLGSGWGELGATKPKPVESMGVQDEAVGASGPPVSTPAVTLISPLSQSDKEIGGGATSESEPVLSPVPEPTEPPVLEPTPPTDIQENSLSQPAPQPLAREEFPEELALASTPIQETETKPEADPTSLEEKRSGFEAEAVPTVATVEPEPSLESATDPSPAGREEEGPVVELTELVDDKQQSDETKESSTYGPLRVDRLFEITGGDTEVSANEGRLRLMIPFRVVQGKFVFFLEQVSGTQFTGFLVSPSGNRHKVDLDFQAIMDIKEVFDKVMLSS